MKPAARKNDQHNCSAKSPGPKLHVGGKIISGSKNIIINNRPAARVGDMTACAEGSIGKIASGSKTVTFNHKSAARQNDQTSHGGKISTGSNNVYIGDGGNPVACGNHGIIEIGNFGEIFIGGASTKTTGTETINKFNSSFLKPLKNSSEKPIYGEIKIKLINDYDDYAKKNPPYFTEQTDYTLIYLDKNQQVKILRQKIQNNEIMLNNFDLTQSFILQISQFVIAVNNHPVKPDTEIIIPGLAENQIHPHPSTKQKTRTIFLTILHPPIILDFCDNTTSTKKITDNQLKYFKGKGNNATIFIHGFNIPKGGFAKQKIIDQLAKEINMLPDNSNYAFALQKYHNLFNDSVDSTIYHSPEIPSSIVNVNKKLTKDIKPYFNPPYIKSIEVFENSLIIKLDAHINYFAEITNGTGACNWLIHMEDNFNQSTKQFDRSDYRPFTRFINIFWPSDIGSPLNYMQAVTNANQTGKQLIPLIQQLHQENITVNIVAHSAGNVVLLQLMNLLGKQKISALSHVFLWQPAVPNDALSNILRKNNKNYNYPYAYQSAKKIIVLFSKNDNILGACDHGIFNTLCMLRSKLMDPAAGFEIALVVGIIACIDACHPQNNFDSIYKLGNMFQQPFSCFLKSHHHCETFYQNWVAKKQNHQYHKHGMICAFAPNLTMQTNQIKHDHPVLFTQLYIAFLAITQGNLNHGWPLKKQFTDNTIKTHSLNTGQLKTISVDNLIQVITKSCKKIRELHCAHTDKFRQNITKNLHNKSICDVVTIIISVLKSTNVNIRPAMGYSGPDETTKKLLQDKLQLVPQQNELLHSHSAMKIPTEELMTNIYQQQIWQKNPNFKLGKYQHENS